MTASPFARTAGSVGLVWPFVGCALVGVLGFSIAGCDRPERTDSVDDRSPAKNVLLITLDAARQDHFSFNGYERETTPNITRLARNGVVFRDVIPTSCSTKGSLTSLFTGLDHRYHQLHEHEDVIDDRYLTLAEVFRASGYETAGFVATPQLTAKHNYGQGFDVYEDFLEARGVDYVEASRVVQGIVRFLKSRESNGRPFFVYAHFEEPHPPWNYPTPWSSDEETPDRFFDKGCTYLPSAGELASLTAAQRAGLIAKYDGALHAVDQQIGILLEVLGSRGLLEGTIVAVSTDHGIELAERYSASHGYNPFDEVLRGFLVLNDGSRQLPSPDGPLQARIFDIGPTLLALAGIEIPAAFEGVDLLGGSDVPPRYAFSFCYSGVVVRSLKHKLVLFWPRSQNEFRDRGAYPVPDRHMLFDLESDPGETRDVKDEFPQVFAEMTEELRAYREDLATEFIPGSTLTEEQLGEEALERLRALGYLE